VENEFKIYSKLSSLPYFITNRGIEMHLFKLQTFLCFLIRMSTLQQPTSNPPHYDYFIYLFLKNKHMSIFIP